MNPIQRMMLRVFSAPAHFVNYNLARREGLLGRIGRFWSFGVREYGMHPTTKILKLMNSNYIQLIKYTFSRQTYMRTILQKQNSINGYAAANRFFNYLHMVVLIALPFVCIDWLEYKRKAFFLGFFNGQLSRSSIFRRASR